MQTLLHTHTHIHNRFTGSAVRPILFALHMLLLANDIRKHFISMKLNYRHIMKTKAWMSLNSFLLNSDKSGVIIFGPHCFQFLSLST